MPQTFSKFSEVWHHPIQSQWYITELCNLRAKYFERNLFLVWGASEARPNVLTDFVNLLLYLFPTSLFSRVFPWTRHLTHLRKSNWIHKNSSSAMNPLTQAVKVLMVFNLGKTSWCAHINPCGTIAMHAP